MSLQELDSALQSGARTNRFLLEFILPTGITSDVRKLSLLALSVSVPGKTRGAITINYGGKTGRIAGDELTDETFPVSLQVPQDSETVYKLFNDWILLPDTEDNYKTNMKCSQLNLQNEKTQTWDMKGCWVSTLPPVDFNRTSQDEIKEFEVTFTLDDVVPV